MNKFYLSFLQFILFCNMGYAQQAINFTITDINGQEQELQDYLDQGYTVLLDFFFVDCGPCNTWMPEIVGLEEFYADEPFIVIGCSDRDDNAYIQGFLDQYNGNGIAAGTQGGGDAVIDLYAATYNFTGFPTYSIICPDGSITWDVWPLTAGVPTLHSAIDACLENTVPNPPNATYTTAVNCLEVAFTNTSTNADLYLWDFGDDTSSSEEQPTHTYQESGEYTVTLTAVDSETSNQNTSTTVINVSSCTTGVADEMSNNLIRYFNHNLHITTELTGQLSIMDITGKVVRKAQIDGQNTTINCSELSKGIYIAKLECGTHSNIINFMVY